MAILFSVSYGAPIAVRRSTTIAARQNASASGATYSGSGTWFEIGLGACGQTQTDEDPVVAIAASTFDSFPGATANPNENPICNKNITLYCKPSAIVVADQDKSVTATITDRCAGCAGPNDVDMSPYIFEQLLGDLGIGRADITWTFS
ncbi:RlpA-like double-psi beta-barrel-protein domain-containing protein-containing protein [Lentinula aciculospora]|uniref:RlpA-like double-psi beta-barrel-protein domain-containing protein-containing protein n=1 Tax=Lentinula aciculospora TaxID=153920 RepID=A0A9W9DUB5_9AGAR|nr:RlpA-like double-psi beta-barrel-protein domain-containing protein-containing protein [Lentinula aciculospora]